MSIFDPLDPSFLDPDLFKTMLTGCPCGSGLKTKLTPDGKRMLCGNCRMKDALELLRAK